MMPVDRQVSRDSWKKKQGPMKAAHFRSFVRRIESAVAPDLYPNERGPMMGMLAGVKPAFKFSVEREWDPTRLKRLLAAEGVQSIVLDKLVVDVGQLKDRLKEERELAEELGWDFEQSMEENLARVSTHREASPQAQALAGFVLGYPESAIKGMRRQGEFKERGIPLPCQLWDLNFAVDTSSWDPGDAEFLQTMRQMRKKVYDDYKRTRDRQELNNQLLLFRQSYAINIAKIYENYFNLNKEEIDFLLSEREVNITNNKGQEIYHFLGFNQQNEEAEDVKALRMKVAEGFREL